MTNVYTNIERHYRKLQSLPDEQKFQLIIDETDILVTIPQGIALDLAVNHCFSHIHELRMQIKSWNSIDSQFISSLTPRTCSKNAPKIIQKMCYASKLAQVGPFAAVAGTIAQMLAENLAIFLEEHHLPQEVIVENGGDTYLISKKSRIVGILTNPTEKEQIGIQTNDFPVSFCSSSATIGHSLSFGKGDLSLVRSKDAAIADAFATAYGNMLNSASDITKIIEHAQKRQDYIQGIFLQCGGQIGIWGNIELVSL